MLVLLTLLYFGPMMFNVSYNLIDEPLYAEKAEPEFDTKEGDLTIRVRHYTMIFATFIMMSLFNMFNSRKLGLKEFNIFSNFFNNIWFFVIIAIEFAATWGMVFLGSDIFRTLPPNLPMGIAIFSFGIGTWLVAAGMKATPPELAEKIPDLINENAGEGSDFLSVLQKKFAGEQVKRTETERLLDSQ